MNFIDDAWLPSKYFRWIDYCIRNKNCSIARTHTQKRNSIDKNQRTRTHTIGLQCYHLTNDSKLRQHNFRIFSKQIESTHRPHLYTVFNQIQISSNNVVMELLNQNQRGWKLNFFSRKMIQEMRIQYHVSANS